jgi:hypothetical protein
MAVMGWKLLLTNGSYWLDFRVSLDEYDQQQPS